MRIGLMGFGSMGKTHLYCVQNLKYFFVHFNTHAFPHLQHNVVLLKTYHRHIFDLLRLILSTKTSIVNV